MLTLLTGKATHWCHVSWSFWSTQNDIKNNKQYFWSPQRTLWINMSNVQSTVKITTISILVLNLIFFPNNWFDVVVLFDPGLYCPWTSMLSTSWYVHDICILACQFGPTIPFSDVYYLKVNKFVYYYRIWIFVIYYYLFGTSILILSASFLLHCNIHWMLDTHLIGNIWSDLNNLQKRNNWIENMFHVIIS